MMICLFVQTGLLLYLIQKFHDYNEILVVLSSMSPIFQAAYKVTALHKHSKRIRFVLNSMWKKFWPHDLAEGTKEAFKSGYITRLWMMLFLLTTGFLFSLASITSPIFSKNRELPYKTLFPFDFHATPIYQIIYILQIGTHYLIDMSVCGFDFLFMGICAGLTNQYILLGKTYEQVGTENMVPLYNKIRKLDGRRLLGFGQDRKFLRLCIEHHQLLTRTTVVVEEIFNVVAFLQLCSSVLATCVSGFIATKDDVSSSQIAIMGPYLIGHLIQLYIYCGVGNELYQVMRLSFSSYTLLATITKE
ncbi:odorant receptor Or1 isoform X2 [Leptinotarsa decemlineata]|uniref:odorant receptor Or1 isoform X2 n=1 Tax=Leptinotarsa decemlineata TaxID=7539 RepID=UPI003D308E86